MKKWIEEVLASEKRIALPIMTHPGIEYVGKTVREAVTDGEVHFAAIKALAERYPSAACTVIMDLTVEAEAFGAKILIPEEEIPTVTERLVSDAASVEALQVPSLDAGRVPEYLKANRLAAEHITDRPVLAGCIGPFSLAGRLYDMSEIMVAIYIEPDVIMALLDKCTAFLIDYCKALKATGVAGVVMAEPAAGLLSNEDHQMYATPYVKQIVDAVQDDDFTVILHNCGNTGQCTGAMVETGAAAMHFGNLVDIPQALTEVPEHMLVMGNLDPVGIFKQGTPEQVAAATTDLLEKTRGAKNFVISSGCDLPPAVPEANLEAFFGAVEAYNK
ncbi:MAG: uroporphyrinogen decarboxylase family protein [Alistipes sp.]|nr:uroporphyrinogen decarboxylase family protein [Alistipes sp.]MBQ8916639.1 uroporphyrinogen decarboxylase family protein [Alistipes sp.]